MSRLLLDRLAAKQEKALRRLGENHQDSIVHGIGGVTPDSSAAPKVGSGPWHMNVASAVKGAGRRVSKLLGGGSRRGNSAGCASNGSSARRESAESSAESESVGSARELGSSGVDGKCESWEEKVVDEG